MKVRVAKAEHMAECAEIKARTAESSAAKAELKATTAHKKAREAETAAARALEMYETCRRETLFLREELEKQRERNATWETIDTLVVKRIIWRKMNSMQVPRITMQAVQTT